MASIEKRIDSPAAAPLPQQYDLALSSLLRLLLFPIANLHEFNAFAKREAGEKNNYSISIASFLEVVRTEMPAAEITHLDQARRLLLSLAFKLDSLHVDNPDKIGPRADVVQQRMRFAPFYYSLLPSS